MPKAKPYPEKDEDEKTHVESGWEDEASTTVEQGELASKARAIAKGSGHEPQQHNTSHTHTGTGVDEPTMDDQHAPVLSAITPIRPDNNARLIITQGNDAGQEIEIRPGKSYTIGRAIDNDVVLTDIAVSRKHFDLKFEDGAWIIVDRGSGNGTVVNGNVEDNPFLLASGDQIEIGNTIFRYEQPNGEPRPSQRTYEVDDEEASTVAGKPLREVVEEPPLPPQRLARPKTLPPPVPMRPANSSVPPPPLRPDYPVQPLPASTLPMPQMANRPPLSSGPPLSPGSPTMLGDAMGMPLSMQASLQNAPMGPGSPMSPLAPTTLPGQAPAPRPSYPYPQAMEIPPHSVHAQMLQIQTANRRSDGSTAHVPPQPYDPNNYGMAPPRAYSPPQLSKRTKLAIAGLGLALLTGIVTAAVVKSSSKPKPVAGEKRTATGTKEAKVVAKQKPTVEPITTPAPPPKQEPPKQEAPKADIKVVKAEPPKQEPPKQEPPKQEPPKQEAPKQEPPKQIAKAEPPKQEPPKQEPPKQEPPKQEPKPDPRAAKRERDEAARREREERRKAAAERARESRRDVTATPAPKRVATADTASARDKANSLYENRKFNDAASVLQSAARNAEEDEVKDLKRRAEWNTGLGKALAQGNAPAAKPPAAFDFLVQASNLDSNLGGHFATEINTKLAAVAPKAAVAFIAQKDYGHARSAWLKATALGSTDPNLALVKQKLEAFAGELYADAAREINSNPGPAKEKLKQIRQLVDAKSPWAVKAQALLNKN